MRTNKSDNTSSGNDDEIMYFLLDGFFVVSCHELKEKKNLVAE